MAHRENISIEAGEIALSAVVDAPSAFPLETPAPVVVCCHGLMSYKGSAKFVAMGEALANAGFCALRFDFSGCGESPHRKGPGIIDARVRDLSAVLDFVSTQKWFDGRLGLLGSSMGGYIALLAANEAPERIRATVSWASPFEFANVKLDPEGLAELRSMYPEGYRFGGPKELGSLGAASRVLLIHGRQDEAVDWRAGVRIYNSLKDPKELLLFDTADHQITDESWRKAAIRAGLEWFERYLTRENSA